jgi:Protein of unknown function (DUF3489)
MIREMIGRPKGATLAEIMRLSEWQAQSVRAFVATAARKHRIRITSFRNEAGERVYQIER